MVTGWAERTGVKPADWLDTLGDGRARKPRAGEVMFWRTWLADGWTDHGEQIHPKTLSVLARDTRTPEKSVSTHIRRQRDEGRLEVRDYVQLAGAPRSTPLYRLTTGERTAISQAVRDAFGPLAALRFKEMPVGWTCEETAPPEWARLEKVADTYKEDTGCWSDKESLEKTADTREDLGSEAVPEKTADTCKEDTSHLSTSYSSMPWSIWRAPENRDKDDHDDGMESEGSEESKGSISLDGDRPGRRVGDVWIFPDGTEMWCP